MFESFERGWKITKVCGSVIQKDKELIFFPILSGFFSTLFLLAMIIPSFLFLLGAQSQVEMEITHYILIFITYLGLAFITTFFNVCTTFTAKERFSGKNATFGQSFGFAVKKIHLIFLWSLVSATVGLILRILENIARKNKGIGKIVIGILTAILGLAWSLITIFVVPAMVYDDLTPFKAIKKSISVLRKTWGEKVVGYMGAGMVFGLTLALIFAVGFFGSIAMLIYSGLIAALIFFVVCVILFILVYLLYGLFNTIFNAALYQYASTGKIPSGFTKDALHQAVV